MERLYIKDFLTQGGSDSEAIAACLRHWNTLPSKPELVFDGRNWFIDEAILLYDGMTVIIDGCAIRQNDEVFDNVFRSANFRVNPDDSHGLPLSIEPIRDVKILGRNGAEIVGCEKNRRGRHPHYKEESEMVYCRWGWRTLQIYLLRCDGFEIGGFTFEKLRSYAVSLEMCSDGYIHDLHFGFDSHSENGDGVHFFPGCHHCRVEHITGYTSDDTVACTAFLYTRHVRNRYNEETRYPLECSDLLLREFGPRALDVHDIDISGVYTAGLQHTVICLAANGLQVYNITIRDVREGGEGEQGSAVKIYTGYGGGYNDGDLHDITVDGVTSRVSNYAVECNTKVRDVVLSNIVQRKPDCETFSIACADGITIV